MAENEHPRVSVETHIDRLQEVLSAAITRRGAETVQLSAPGLGGRISAQTVTAQVPLPGFDNSQMDGFAVRLADLRVVDGAAEVLLAGVVAAGDEPRQLPAGAAMAVMTGAPVPDGTELVIPVERTVEGSFEALIGAADAGAGADGDHGTEEASAAAGTEAEPRRHRFFGYRAPLLTSLEDAQSEPTGPFSDDDWAAGRTLRFVGLGETDLRAGRFIRRAGSDVAEGEVLVRAGEALSPAHLGVLAAAGQAELNLVVRTRVLVLSTGDEVRTPGSPLRAGQLYDADTPLIRAVLESFGCVVETARVGTDEAGWFVENLEALITLHEPHVLVTSGGISRGAYEVVRQVLEPRGVTFGAVAQQPGGPQGWGLLARPSRRPRRRSEEGTADDEQGPLAVICLPGNPVSCAVSLETLVRPALAAVGPACPPPRRLRVRITEDLSSPAGVRQFRRVRFTPSAAAAGPGEPLAVETVGGPGSHLLGHLARAEALLEIGEEDQEVPAGSLCDALLLTGRKLP